MEVMPAAHRIIPFEQLDSADLVVDAVYQGGSYGNVRDDPLARLLPCGNQGGFRTSRNQRTGKFNMAILYTSGEEPDWPDVLDRERGLFIYFGDNRTAGSELHDTPKGGNALLRQSFEAMHRSPPNRADVPPFFVFEKADQGRDVRFLGLAVPGSGSATEREDLVAL